MKNKLCLLLIALVVSLISFAGAPTRFQYGNVIYGQPNMSDPIGVLGILSNNDGTYPSIVHISSSVYNTTITAIYNIAIGHDYEGEKRAYCCPSAITIPQTITEIKSDAFNGCSNLDSIFVEQGNTIYDSRDNCNAIIETKTNTLIVGCKNTKIPQSVTKIGVNAFRDRSYFTTISIPHTIKEIGASAFQNCEYVEELVLGAWIEKMGENAFAECPRIYSITCYADIAPTIEANTFADVSSNAELHVPVGAVKRYKIYDYWGRFNIMPIGAENTTNGNLSVRPSSNDAVFTWPANSEADSYTLTINKDDATFCMLIFNGEGQLTNTTFAPARNGERHTPAAELTTNGYRFTVTGLEIDAHYTYQIVVKDGNNKVLNTYKGEFTTNNSTAIDNISAYHNIVVRKYIRNGQIVIQRGDRVYTTTGIEIK